MADDPESELVEVVLDPDELEPESDELEPPSDFFEPPAPARLSVR